EKEWFINIIKVYHVDNPKILYNIIEKISTVEDELEKNIKKEMCSFTTPEIEEYLPYGLRILTDNFPAISCEENLLKNFRISMVSLFTSINKLSLKSLYFLIESIRDLCEITEKKLSMDEILEVIKMNEEKMEEFKILCRLKNDRRLNLDLDLFSIPSRIMK